MARTKVKVVKPFSHNLRVFEVGEVGEIVVMLQVENPLKWEGKMVYDYYVKFPEYYPIGVHEDEIEILGGKYNG